MPTTRKKRRLKAPIRRFLLKTYVFSKRVVISGAIAIGTVNTFLPVQAEVRQKDVIKNIANLSNANLTNSTTLKNTVVNTYNSLNDTNESVDNTKVYVTTPLVVTQPTIANSTITVVTEDGTESKDTTSQPVSSNKNNKEADQSEKVSVPATSTATPEATESPHESLITSDEQSSTSDENSSETAKNNDSEALQSKSEATSTSNVTKSDTVDKESSEKVESSDNTIDLDKTDSVPKVTNSDTEDTDNAKQSNSLVMFPEIKLPDVKPTEALPVGSSSEETLDLDDIQNDAVEDNTLDIVLKQDSVEITDGSEFKPEDYIIQMHGKSNVLPLLLVDSNVKSDTDGDYTVKYTLIDIDGSSISKSIDVKIKLPANIIAEQKAKAAAALQQFVDEHNGNAYDADYAYGDQCWDLFGKYCIEKDLEGKIDYGTKPYGYAYGVSLKYETSGASKYFDAIKPEDIQPGDWLFWDQGSSCPLSHVALLIEKYDDGTGLCLSQTKGEGTRLVKLQLDVMDVNFRPKGKIAWGK